MLVKNSNFNDPILILFWNEPFLKSANSSNSKTSYHSVSHSAIRTTIVEVLLSNKRIEFFIATLIFLCFNLVIIYFSGSRVQVWRRRNWWWSILCVSIPIYSCLKLDHIETKNDWILSIYFLDLKKRLKGIWTRYVVRIYCTLLY